MVGPILTHFGPISETRKLPKTPLITQEWENFEGTRSDWNTSCFASTKYTNYPIFDYVFYSLCFIRAVYLFLVIIFSEIISMTSLLSSSSSYSMVRLINLKTPISDFPLKTTTRLSKSLSSVFGPSYSNFTPRTHFYPRILGGKHLVIWFSEVVDVIKKSTGRNYIV